MRKILISLLLVTGITFSKDYYNYLDNQDFELEYYPYDNYKIYSKLYVTGDTEEVTDLENGNYKIKYINGDEEYGSYKNRKRHGKYTYIYKDGKKETGTYVNGKRDKKNINNFEQDMNIFLMENNLNKEKIKDGKYEEFFFNKTINVDQIVYGIETGTYVNLKKEGEFKREYYNKDIYEKGTYVNNEKTGDYVLKANGYFKEEGTYENDKKNGRYIYQSLYGYTEFGENKNDLRDGEYLFVYNYGANIVEKGTYVNGKREGAYTTISWDPKIKNKRVEKGTYINDYKEGEYKVYVDNKVVNSGKYIYGFSKTENCYYYFAPKRRYVCVN